MLGDKATGNMLKDEQNLDSHPTGFHGLLIFSECLPKHIGAFLC